MELVARNEGYTREIEWLRARVSRLEAAGSAGESGTVRRRSAVVGGGEVDGDGDDEMDMDDKRKTWMTCHSDEDEE